MEKNWGDTPSATLKECLYPTPEFYSERNSTTSTNYIIYK